MRLSEKQAKFKFCPLLTTPEGKFRFCQGSACMMWRFIIPGKTSETDEGYCGMAGGAPPS